MVCKPEAWHFWSENDLSDFGRLLEIDRVFRWWLQSREYSLQSFTGAFRAQIGNRGAPLGHL